MSSVQAVIAALNQQSTLNGGRPHSSSSASSIRQSKYGSTDISSIKNRFASSSQTPPAKRSSSIDKPIISERTSSLNRASSPISTYQKNATSSPSSSSTSTSFSSGINSNTPCRYSRLDLSTRTKKESPLSVDVLKDQLKQVTLERDQLKQQLDSRTIDTPTSSTYVSPTMMMTTALPPSPLSQSPCWFDINRESEDESMQIDHEDIITEYNHQCYQRVQQQCHAASLQQQLAACEIGTQWMMSKYLGELEQERLHTKSLITIVQNQEELISAMENSVKPTLAAPAATTSHQQQQTFLLKSQLELQRMELDDKQEMLVLMADERDLLVRKISQLTQQLHEPHHHLMENTTRQHRNHPRTVSASSSCSSSSYNTTLSSSTLSSLDWIQFNDKQHHHYQQHHHRQSSPLSLSLTTKSPSRPYSPPQTPPPREKLPPLPTPSSALSASSSASSLTLSSVSSTPRSTLILTPSSYALPPTPDVCSSSSSSMGSSLVTDCQAILTHQSSMPDIRTLHEHHYHHHHHGYHASDASVHSADKRVLRQKSFWKGWRQRLSN